MKKSLLKADMLACDHLDNSVSTSPKNISGESRCSSQNKEFIFNPEEDFLPISAPEISNQNESGMISKIFTPNPAFEKSSSESTNKN